MTFHDSFGKRAATVAPSTDASPRLRGTTLYGSTSVFAAYLKLNEPFPVIRVH